MQYYAYEVTKSQIKAQEALYIEKIIKDEELTFLDQNGSDQTMRLGEALHYILEYLDPNWFPSDTPYVVCNVADLPANYETAVSMDLARELLNATENEISLLTKEKILRIFRAESNSLQELLTDD